MAALERVMQMKSEGYTEPQIIDALKGEGVSPKEIYNALTQSTIKSELSQAPMAEQSTEGYSPSGVMQDQVDNTYQQEQTQDPNQKYPEYQGYGEQNNAYSQEPVPQEASGQYPQYQQYPEYQAPQQQQTDIETINEIAEQIVEEKTVELKKQISSFKNYNEETKAEFERINKKLEKMENNFNELQVAILRKIGEYGENIKNISSEMHETQDSFSKILNPLTDNIRELQKLTGDLESPVQKQKQKEEIQEEEIKQTQRQPKTKPEPGFESYLR
jgi:hypothetical protein